MTDVDRQEKSLPAALVLALASAMIAIGATAYYVARPERGLESVDAGAVAPRAARDLRDERSVAETYLDAWRKRDHATALAVSEGQAHGEALARKQAEERLDPAQRAATAEAWGAMATSRLRFVEERRRDLGDGRVYLEGRAEGTFLGQPYARLVGFEIARRAEGFRVLRMDLGSQLGVDDGGPSDGSAAGSAP
ncbi:MAG: hypothetical protein U0230_18955 [Polyangiales bacterium]